MLIPRMSPGRWMIVAVVGIAATLGAYAIVILSSDMDTANVAIKYKSTVERTIWVAESICFVIYFAVIGRLAIRRRMTTRGWMLAVVVAAAMLAPGMGLLRRVDRFRALARAHHDRVFALIPAGKHWSVSPDEDTKITIINSPDGGSQDNEEMTKEEGEPVLRHFRLEKKYDYAADHPWFPVPPDPPEPK